MRKFLLGILCGLILGVLALVVLSAALVRFGSGEEKSSIPSSSTLVLRLEGEMVETAPPEMPLPFLESATPSTVVDFWAALNAAATDNRIKAVALMPRGVGAGWAKLDEMRSAIATFRKSGKPVIAWLRTPGTREYYLALAADKIYLAEEDRIDLKGLRAELTYYKGTLDKLGVQMEVEHIGKYKDAGDPYSRTTSTPETREVINSVLDRVYATLVDAIAQGRKKTPEQVKKLLDDGPFLATQAVAAGLVDGLKYEDEYFEEIERSGASARVNLRTYARDAVESQRGTRVAFVTGAGPIGRGSARGFGDDQAILSEDFIKVLRQVRDDDRIRAAIVRVDSPGGDAIASDDILREMKLLSRKKPIVISMSDVAASGGYFIAATGDPIIAYPNTFTGSIGVVYSKPNLKGLYEKIGFSHDVITRGRNADLDSDLQPMSDAARAKLREGIRATYDGFVRRVADARKRKPEEIEPLAQGRAWLGSQAIENKLIDSVGGIDKAIEVLKAKAKLDRDARVRLIQYPQRVSVWAKLFGRETDKTVEGEVRAWLARNGIRVPAWVGLRPGMQRAMLYSIEIR